MKLEEVLPALRQGATIRRASQAELTVTLGETHPIVEGGRVTQARVFDTGDIEAEDWEIVLPEREEGHADTESRAPSTADRPVPGYGGFVIDIAQHAVVSMQDQSVGRVRYWLDDLSGPEIAQVDGRWLYVDPSMPKVNG